MLQGTQNPVGYLIVLLHWFKIYGNFTGTAKICLVVSLYREGSVPAACAAGLFSVPQCCFGLELIKFYESSDALKLIWMVSDK